MALTHTKVVFCFLLCLMKLSVAVSDTTPMIRVYDMNTQELMAFQDEFIRLVLDTQAENGDEILRLYANEPLDREGYIINQEGHLVPFKVYKKGMCMLHPRNCKGGSRFNKRTNNGNPVSSDKMYKLELMKRQFEQDDSPTVLQLYDESSNDRLFPSEAALRAEEPNGNELQDYHNVQSYKTFSPSDKHEQLDTMFNTAEAPNNKLYENSVDRPNSAVDYQLGALADPPPLHKKVSAIIEEYPLFETLEDLIANYNANSGSGRVALDHRADILNAIYPINQRR